MKPLDIPYNTKPYIYIYIFIYMYFYTRLMLALDFVIPISSTSLPGGNLVDGLPPAASSIFIELMFEGTSMTRKHQGSFFNASLCVYLVRSTLSDLRVAPEGFRPILS